MKTTSTFKKCLISALFLSVALCCSKMALSAEDVNAPEPIQTQSQQQTQTQPQTQSQSQMQSQPQINSQVKEPANPPSIMQPPIIPPVTKYSPWTSNVDYSPWVSYAKDIETCKPSTHLLPEPALVMSFSMIIDMSNQRGKPIPQTEIDKLFNEYSKRNYKIQGIQENKCSLTITSTTHHLSQKEAPVVECQIDQKDLKTISESANTIANQTYDMYHPDAAKRIMAGACKANFK